MAELPELCCAGVDLGMSCPRQSEIQIIATEATTISRWQHLNRRAMDVFVADSNSEQFDRRQNPPNHFDATAGLRAYEETILKAYKECPL